MNNKFFILLIAVVMVISSLGFIVSYSENGVSTHSQFQPLAPVGGTHNGNATIYANGTVSNSTVIGQSGNSYFLQCNLNGTLRDLRSASAVSGNGFKINVTGADGLMVINITTASFSDLNITTNSNTGICIYNSSSVSINDSNVSSVCCAIYDDYSGSLNLAGDFLTAYYGVYLHYTTGISANSSHFVTTEGVYEGTSTADNYFNNDTFDFTYAALFLDGCNVNNLTLTNSVLIGHSTGTTRGVELCDVIHNVKIENNVFVNLTEALYANTDVGVNFMIQGNYFYNINTALYLFDLYNVLVSGNTFNHTNSYSVEECFVVNSTIMSNVFLGGSTSDAIYLDYTANIYISGNEFNGTGYAMYICDSNSFTVYNNLIYNSTTGAVYVSSVATSNVNVSNNVIVNAGTDGISLSVDSGTNYVINNNLIVNASYGVEVCCNVQNITIDNNTIYNISKCSIFTDYDFGLTISWNHLLGFTGNPSSYGIYAEDSQNVVISHNVVAGNSTRGVSEAITTCYSSSVTVFDNSLSYASYPLYLGDTGNLTVFSNTATNGTDGLYSVDNLHFSYYGNTISNFRTGLVSCDDIAGQIFGNTFYNSSSYASYLCCSTGVVLYHNNFITGNTTKTYMSGNVKVFWNLSLPVGGNYWSAYNGSGTNGIGTTPFDVNGTNMDYLPLTSMWSPYTVSFVETGLPAGMQWAVSLGSTMSSATMQTVTFSPSAAEHISVSYAVENVHGYTATPASGSVALNGSSQVISVAFTAVKYNTTFTETGLPSGQSWSVTIGSQTVSSTTSSLVFSLANGTYNYTVAAVSGYHSSVASGTIQVNGSTQSIGLQFSQNTYVLTISETGLPAGDSWSVNVSGTMHTTTQTSIQVTLVSGTYNVSITAPAGYSVTLSANSVTINNANATVTAVFKNTTKSTGSASSGAIYEGLGIGAAVGVIAGVFGSMLYSGTGVFRKFKKGSGGSP